jgi:RNA polymerase sigma factor (sigma-70 family)
MDAPNDATKPTADANAAALLAVRCRLGEEDAWRELVEAWQPRFWRYALGMLGRRADAEEALQGVWLQVVRSFAKLRDPARLPEWMYGVARRVLLGRLRRRYGADRPTEPLDGVVEPEERDGGPRLELREDVVSALERLPDVDREAVVLHYLEERPVAEIAALVAVPVGTVKSRLFRGRRRLFELLNATGERR